MGGKRGRCTPLLLVNVTEIRAWTVWVVLGDMIFADSIHFSVRVLVLRLMDAWTRIVRVVQ